MSSFQALRAFSFLAMSAPAFAACGDDAVKPGSLNVNWAHGGPTTTCSSRGVINVEARLYKGTELVVSGSAACPAAAQTGSIGIADITPGTYRLVTEATDVDGKGLYFAEVAKQNVAEGKTTESGVVTLAAKPGQLIVDWTVPGQKCSSSDITDVEVVLYYDAGTVGREVGRQKVKCDNVFESPEDGTNQAGVIFEALEPNADVILEAFGYDGNTKIAKATSQAFTISIGDEIDSVMNLTLCTGACD